VADALAQRVLLLGAGHHQLAPIAWARRAGLFTITCDNRPDNPGHGLADKSFDVSIVDREAVLALARAERVDAILSYGSDVGAPTAAYVSEKLGLPGNPYDAVLTLTNKGRFRRFQRDNGFFCPSSATFTADELRAEGAVAARLGDLRYPAMVKPVDSSGAKGVSRLDDPRHALEALRHALSFSACGQVIAEEHVQAAGYQVCGEGFLVDGAIAFHAFANEHFAEFVVPVGESFPGCFASELVERAVGVLEDMFRRLGMRHGPFNFDLLFTRAGDVFVIEIGPRNGGNRMPEAIVHSTGIDTIQATLDCALGRDVAFGMQSARPIATYSVHAKRDGVLKGVEYRDGIEAHIVDEALFHSPGTPVKAFTMGSHMIGCLILAFDDYAQMLRTLDDMDRFIEVKLS
jgi:biotin carboxylase